MGKEVKIQRNIRPKLIYLSLLSALPLLMQHLVSLPLTENNRRYAVPFHAMGESIRLIISMRRIIRATKNTLRAVEEEVETDKDSAYQKSLPPLRALHKYLLGSRQRETHYKYR